MENFIKTISNINICDLAEEFDNDVLAALDHLATAKKSPVNLSIVSHHVIEVAHYESDDIACYAIIVCDFATLEPLTCYTSSNRDDALTLQSALVRELAARPELSAAAQAQLQMNRIMLRNRLT